MMFRSFKTLLVKSAPIIFFCQFLYAEIAVKPLPVESFTQHGDYLDLKISPDGTHFAGRFRQDGKTNLLFIRREDMKIVGGVNARKNNVIHSVTWVKDDRVVFEFAEKFHYFDAPIPTGELFAADIGSSVDMLFGYRANDERTGSRLSSRKNTFSSAEILDILPNDDKHILIAEYPWEQRKGKYRDTRVKKPIIHRLNIFSGKKKRLELIPYNNAEIVTSEGGNVHFVTWKDKSNNRQSVYRNHKKDEWKQVSSKFNIPGESRPISFNNETGKAYFHGTFGDKRMLTIYELDVHNGEVTPIFDNRTADIADWLEDDTTSTPVVGYSYFEGPQYHYANKKSQLVSIHKALAKAFGGQDIAITSWTKDKSLFLVRVSSDINPGEYYLYNGKTKGAEFIWANRSWIDPRDMAKMKHLEVPTRDGLKIQSYLTLPKSAPETSKPPLVVLIHGGPHARDYWQFDNEVQLFANRGYAVLQVNFRGSSGYGEEFLEMGHREWGGKMIDDIIDASRWAIDKGYVDGERVCAYGASYGGYAALMMAVREPDFVKCTAGYVGVYDLNLMYTKGDIRWTKRGKSYLAKTVGEDKAMLKRYSPIFHADKIKAPVFLIHGKSDLRVPYAHAKAMRSALEKEGKDVKWLTYGTAGHGVWNEKDRVELYTELLSFFDNHIGEKALNVAENR